MESVRIESEQLPGLLAALRAAGEAEDEIQQRLISLFAIEEERVADAAVLAELLLPALRGQIPPAAAEVPAPRQTTAAVAAASQPTAPPPPPPTRKRSTDIATFIDEMLAQESATARRAS